MFKVEFDEAVIPPIIIGIFIVPFGLIGGLMGTLKIKKDEGVLEMRFLYEKDLRFVYIPI
jgi:hypothetical protein